jgi:glycosyltransferase involved in cell wall biosynthesis
MTCKDKPLISVVIPVFKGLEYLRFSIESILNQTYKNIEIIVIDDDPTNVCELILSNYDDPRIRYFRGNRAGLPAARNYGVNLANGEYIANMDADDISVSTRLATQLEYLLANNVDICGSCIKLFGKLNYRIIKYPKNDKEIKFAMLNYSSIANPTALIKSSILKKHHYRDTVAEDYDLWVRLAKLNYSFANISKPLLYYRMHDDQTSVTKYNQMISDSMPIVLDYSKYYLSNSEFSAYKYLLINANNPLQLEDSISMGNFLAQVAKKRLVDNISVSHIIVKYFNNTKPMNIMVFFAYIRIVLDNKFTLFNWSNFYLFVQSALKINRDGYLFNFLKKFAS